MLFYSENASSKDETPRSLVGQSRRSWCSALTLLCSCDLIIFLKVSLLKLSLRLELPGSAWLPTLVIAWLQLPVPSSKKNHLNKSLTVCACKYRKCWWSNEKRGCRRLCVFGWRTATDLSQSKPPCRSCTGSSFSSRSCDCFFIRPVFTLVQLLIEKMVR